MGKWDRLRDVYPKAPIEASWQEKIDFILDSPAPKDVLGPADDDMDLKVRHLSDWQLKDLYLKARKESDDLAAKAKVVDLQVEAYTRLLADRMLEAGESSTTYDDGVRLGVSGQPYPVVKDQAALLKWVKDKGLESLLTLNYQTLRGLVVERLEGKVPEPLPAGVDVFVRDSLTCHGRPKDV